MQLLDAHSAPDYLRRVGLLGANEPITCRELAGGVSNCVLYIARPTRPHDALVLKQARPQLRTADPWFCSVERILREIDVLRAIAARVEHGRVPHIFWEDRTNFLFVMSAAPEGCPNWKQQLLARHIDPATAHAAGDLLGQIHANTWGNADIARQFADQSYFLTLRVDPYYRAVVRACPQAASEFERLIVSLADHRLALVHADFAPKNLLVSNGRMMLVDFETGHWGDPAFDLGFFLSHLMLKAFHHAPHHEPLLDLTTRFWQAYAARLAPALPAAEYAALEARGAQHLAGCAWARLDGTSKIDYLSDPARRDAVRSLCRHLLSQAPRTWPHVLDESRRRLNAL